MPAKEIKELRQSGKLEEALELAKSELNADPNNIWAKRNLSWVYYDYIKINNSPDHFDTFIKMLTEVKDLDLPADEKMFFDNISWQIGKMLFALSNPTYYLDYDKTIQIFNTIRWFHFEKPSEGYSFIFKGFHKLLKESDDYLLFADWWGFENFLPKDFEKEKLPNGKEIMPIVEQAYITYAKQLLPKKNSDGIVLFDKEKASQFIPELTEIVEKYPQFQYPAYFNAKLLLALGDKENMLDALLPFAKKKRNDFWVWEILAEAFTDDPGKVFACYCKALSCNSPEEMLVNLRQKMAEILIAKKLFKEAKTEIVQLVAARNNKGYKTPALVNEWILQDWYKKSSESKNNKDFYKQYLGDAEAILFSDIPEESVIVEFVNYDKSMLNFIASEKKFGFFKYDRYIKDVKIGDVLKIRIQSGTNEGIYHLYTAVKSNDDSFKSNFIKSVSGNIKIPQGKSFGFVDDIFVHPSFVLRMKLKDGDEVKGSAIKSYNKEKKQWSWKLI